MKTMRFVALLLFCLTSCSGNLFAQANLVAKNVFDWTPTKHEIFSDNESLILATFKNNFYGPGCVLRRMDSDYQIEKKIWVDAGVSAKSDALGNIYVLANRGFDYDIGLDPFKFEFRKYDRELNLIFNTTIDTIPNPNWNQINGDFAIVEDQALIFFQELRIPVNLNNGELGAIQNDVIFLGNVLAAESLTNGYFAIVTEDGPIIFDEEGMYVNDAEYNASHSFVKKGEWIYGIEGASVLKFNEQFQWQSQLNLSNYINGIHLDHDGNIYLGTSSQLLLLDEEELTTSIIYENEYHDHIWGGYTFQNEVGIVVQEDEDIINQFNQFSANGVRAARPINQETLPDLAVVSAQIVDQQLNETFEFNGAFAHGYDFDFAVEIENKGEQPSEAGFLILHGDCDFDLPHNFCHLDRLVNLNLEPGASTIINLNRIYTWPEYDSIWTEGYEICFSILNSDFSYDKNYSNNSSCFSFLVDTGTEEFVDKNTVHLFPNPASDEIFLEINTPNFSLAEIAIYDLQGKQLKNEAFAHSMGKVISIDVQGWQDGMYFLRGRGTDGSIFVKKITILARGK